MGDKTNIGWTDSTWNPITGCSKVSAGCKHCYAARIWPRLAGNDKTVYFDRAFTNVQCHPEVLIQPVRWVRPRMIFVNSMSDTFHADVPDAFIDQIFAVMLLSGQHIFQVLTKRIERAVSYLSDPDRKMRVVAAARALLASGKADFNGYIFPDDIQWPLPNVWIGTSVEDQIAADARIWQLLNLPATIRFVSVEPLIGAVNLKAVLDANGRMFNALSGEGKLDWVIVGCESGSQRRKLDIDWVRALRAVCGEHEVPFFLKQLFLDGKLVSEPVLDGRHSIELPQQQVIAVQIKKAA